MQASKAATRVLAVHISGSGIISTGDDGLRGTTRHLVDWRKQLYRAKVGRNARLTAQNLHQGLPLHKATPLAGQGDKNEGTTFHDLVALVGSDDEDEDPPRSAQASSSSAARGLRE
ncbi:hypothetical protein PC116_g26770 [Phytophthora cactorum]|uniref:Uncharacterized protein n=1 Tax=Phytophthora cactorum TaxID=29920 RepID=A0A8T1AZR2_9STRA|nr:hypothetical protein PC117_g23748 [Phytophthora cactorum]KAG2923393.1 hypothetical protein PC114_g4793 [Phytophthora cactorum]KAG3185974.1 hypothetical protein C6341_g4096 [Phytophthora cactorum]KAG3199413.1 hypothetical protein PC128_g5331 [Phytophthora cactorum]KAG4224782.1 hypothetical protein PC116_g26770 [Phytophthora cactorum]